MAAWGISHTSRLPGPPGITIDLNGQFLTRDRQNYQHRWPERLHELALALRQGTAAGPQRTSLWLLLQSVLRALVLMHSRRYGSVDPEEAKDIAAEKALELLLRFDRGDWNLTLARPAETARFVSTVARNGLVDRLRRSGRLTAVEDLDAMPQERHHPRSSVTEAPGTAVERNQFTTALLACIRALRARDQTIWFFRVFYEMSSKVISAHPEIRLKPGHVDVILQRSRRRVAECMRTRGFGPDDIPPGAFSELWLQLRNPSLGEGHVP